MSLAADMSSRSCGVAELSHRLCSGATAGTTEKLADPPLCSSLPLNARCGEVGAGHNISRMRSSARWLAFGLSATWTPWGGSRRCCQNKEQIRSQEGSYETNRFTDVGFLPLFCFHRMAANTSANEIPQLSPLMPRARVLPPIRAKVPSLDKSLTRA